MEPTFTLTILRGEERHAIEAPAGANLRRVLLAHGFSPYARVAQRANCGGRGLCATCGVRVAEQPDPRHWHDRVGNVFGYPRLSCQIVIDRPLTVRLLTEKRVWGAPWTRR